MPLSIIGWRQDNTRKEVLTITNNMKPSYIKQKKRSLLASFAVRTGLEPVTPCVTGRYSNQLN